MNVQQINMNKVTMKFTYLNEKKIFAKGEQQIACMKKIGENIEPTEIPECLKNALSLYI